MVYGYPGMKDMGYDTRHGGAYDRGSADSYYSRTFDPHYYEADTGNSDRVAMKDMTAEQITAYTKGFNNNEAEGNFKEWGND